MSLEKKTLNFRAGDWDYLQSAFHSRGIPPSIAIRTIISNFVDELIRREQGQPKRNGDIELGDI